ncbi:nuclear transport factor 2 family protein [Roseibium sp. SCP14]|uniref:nuclear transport factor 2 family protein n=1 Tax=Roseibium sp. SCP14 TaxID=3141375 RepID=UPI003334B4B1
MPGQQNRYSFNGPLQTVFQDFMADWVFSDDHTAQQIMETYFTPDFSAEIDGRHLSHDIFQRRIGRMRQDAEVEEQDFVEMAEDGNRLFSMHNTRGKSLVSGQRFETRAIAFFRFDGKRIKKGYLNSVTPGDPSDADFASRS